MKASLDKIDTIFEFTGSWGIASKCGIKRSSYNGKEVVIVSELYLENPGTSITQISTSLAMQVCERFNIALQNLIYIEHSPEMNSKLSFYNEDNYLVNFDIVDGAFTNPSYTKLGSGELLKMLK